MASTKILNGKPLGNTPAAQSLIARYKQLAALGDSRNAHEDWEMMAIADELEEFYGVSVKDDDA